MVLEGVRTKDNGFYLMGNVNGCYKCIGLKTIFKNILWKNDKNYSFRPNLFVLFEKSKFLREYHLLFCLLYKNV